VICLFALSFVIYLCIILCYVSCVSVVVVLCVVWFCVLVVVVDNRSCLHQWLCLSQTLTKGHYYGAPSTWSPLQCHLQDVVYHSCTETYMRCHCPQFPQRGDRASIPPPRESRGNRSQW